MKFFNLLLLQLTMLTVCQAQSYSIDHYQSDYDTLSNYTSLPLELGTAGEDPYFWEESFNLGFEFPYFGENYSEILMDSDAIGSFPDSENYNMFLFGGASYTIGEITNISYLNSDVRYASTSSNDLQALVIEYHNIYLEDEYEDEGANHFMNFQMWFYENGIIELRFGEIDLTNCSYYFPGQGFSFDNENPNDEIYGPYVSISKDDFSEGACFFDDHTAPSILYDQDADCDVLKSVPPAGYVVRFVPEGVSSLEEFSSELENSFQLTQVNGAVQITGDLDTYKSCSVYDALGKKIMYTEEQELKLDTNNPQFFVFVIEGELGKETHKLIVK